MMQRMRWSAAVRYDTRIAYRAVLRSPNVTIAAVLTLALGVGLNTAIFSVVESLLLRQLPYGAPDRIVALTLHDAVGGDSDRVNAWLPRPCVARAAGGAGFLCAAGGRPVLVGGRSRGEEEGGEPAPLLILTYEFWRRRF